MSGSGTASVTELLHRWRAGDDEALDGILSATYSELRRLARGHLSRERGDHTLQATALLNEALLRLIPRGPLSVENRAAFLRLMSAEMRHRLIDHARRRRADKRGGGAALQPLGTDVDAAIESPGDESELLLARLDGALKRLGNMHPRVTKVVNCRYFLGLTTDATAQRLRISPGSVKRDWTFAKAWLLKALISDREAIS